MALLLYTLLILRISQCFLKFIKKNATEFKSWSGYGQTNRTGSAGPEESFKQLRYFSNCSTLEKNVSCSCSSCSFCSLCSSSSFGSFVVVVVVVLFFLLLVLLVLLVKHLLYTW